MCFIHGRNPADARAHFFALKAIHPAIQGVLLLDGDNRNLPEHEVGADTLTLLRWHRYETENYLLHPESLLRFISDGQTDLFSDARRRKAKEFLEENFPPAAFLDPLKDSDYLIATPASKSILPAFLEAAELRLSKKDYFQIAASMRSSEIHPEIFQKLDTMTAILRPELARVQ